jgi:GNAT superfamily N-acetyltransferase
MDKLITQSSDLWAVVCRPALPKDKADVLALTRHIWEGNDYVPYVWDEWLADPHGMLVVAEYGGQVVGLANLAWKGEDEWWLQGLRVHPHFQGQGIASRLHDYILQAWERNMGGVLRLATSSARLPVHHLCQRTGFTRVGEYRKYAAPALTGMREEFRAVRSGEAIEALDFVRHSPLFAICNHLLYLDWYWGALSGERLGEIIQRGAAYWWHAEDEPSGGLVAVDLDQDDELGRHPYIQLMACSEIDLPELLVAYRRLGHYMGYERVEWLAPEDEAVREALQHTGYQSDWENSLYLFEKRL